MKLWSSSLAAIVWLPLALVVGCSSNEPIPDLDANAPQLPELGYFRDVVDIPTEQNIFFLSTDSHSEFRRDFDAERQISNPRYQRVADFVESFTVGFVYYGETYTAEESYTLQAGNCLSLAIMTTALADLAGVETRFQLVDSVPVFSVTGSLSFKQRHVRVFLHDPSKPPSDGFLVLRPEGVIVDYFPSGREVFVGNISRNEFVSMYYLNTAADMISTKNYDQAFHFVLAALEKAPDNPDALNMLAIVHRRAGYSGKAEEIYQYAISQQPDNVVLLKNYRQLLLSQARLTEAATIEGRLSGLDDPSPLNWLSLAEEAYLGGEYRQAITYFDKAIKLAPYLHNPYFGKAKSYFKLGDPAQAEQSLQLARQYSNKGEQSLLYERKLIALKTSWISDSEGN